MRGLSYRPRRQGIKRELCYGQGIFAGGGGDRYWERALGPRPGARPGGRGTPPPGTGAALGATWALMPSAARRMVPSTAPPAPNPRSRCCTASAPGRRPGGQRCRGGGCKRIRKGSARQVVLWDSSPPQKNIVQTPLWAGLGVQSVQPFPTIDGKTLSNLIRRLEFELAPPWRAAARPRSPRAANR